MRKYGNCEIYHSKIEKQTHFPQKMYKLSKTNIFFSRFEGKRGEKNPNISHHSASRFPCDITAVDATGTLPDLPRLHLHLDLFQTLSQKFVL